MTKQEVRQMATDHGYTEIANKPESYEICFVPDNDYRGFLKRRVPDLEQSVAGGQFVDQDGNVLGTHEGYPFYTIGQRKGLKIALGDPRYVTDIDPETNRVVLGLETDLERGGMWVGDMNYIKYEALPDGMEVLAKIRYKDKGRMSTLSNEGDQIKATFVGPATGVAPGQSAVFYEGDDVLGGGIIQASYRVDVEKNKTKSDVNSL
jgi:tRNA-specific 2-thiouridylase